MMDDGGYDWMAFIGGFATALLLIFLIRRRRKPDLDQAPLPKPKPVEIPAAIRPSILKMRAEGRMIEAIKLVRERTGCDLKAAKNAVERLR